MNWIASACGRVKPFPMKGSHVHPAVAWNILRETFVSDKALHLSRSFFFLKILLLPSCDAVNMYFIHIVHEFIQV